jgi:hypothetical protein
VVISAALAVAGCAGVTPVEDPDRRIEAVYDVPGVSQTEIFTATKIWIANNFRSTVSVIKYESAADGILIGNGTVAFPCAGGACAGKGELDRTVHGAVGHAGWQVPPAIQQRSTEVACHLLRAAAL